MFVFQALDRLARSLRLLLSMLDDLNERGVGIRSLREPLIDTAAASGAMVLHVLGVNAEIERQRDGLERVPRGRARRRDG